MTIVCSATSSHVRMVAGAQTLTTAQCAPVRRYVVDCFHIGSGRFVNSLDLYLVSLKSHGCFTLVHTFFTVEDGDSEYEKFTLPL